MCGVDKRSIWEQLFTMDNTRYLVRWRSLPKTESAFLCLVKVFRCVSGGVGNVSVDFVGVFDGCW